MFGMLFGRLRTRLIGSILKEFERVASTNDLAFEMAERGEPEGTVILAREQDAGKGRHGRIWYSRAGRGLYLSVILRPGLSTSQVGRLGTAVAVAVQHTLRRFYHLSASIKWPNDILVQGRKLAGILLESRTVSDQLQFVVIGIGLNTNWEREDLEGEFRTPPTALNLECGAEIDVDRLLQRLLESLDAAYAALVHGRWSRIRSHANGCLEGKGQLVSARCGDNLWQGKLEGLGDEGELLIALPDGSRHRLYGGECSFVDRD